MKTKPLHRTSSLLFVLGLIFSLNSPSAAADAEPDLAELINLRLAEMKDVAAYKWLNDLPIEDLERERAVIDAAQKSGLRFGFTVTSSQAFFSQQINAAKEIQRHWFQVWRNSNGPNSAPDLNNDVRPRLIELGNRITVALADAIADQERGSNHMPLKISAEGLSAESAIQLAAAAANLEFYANHLDQVIDSRVLRVGTTFDYAPFSFKENGEPLGIDLALAADLANSLGAELKLVETSWPTLMVDLQAGKFDVGMSGISINLQRQRKALFSEPHHTGGKTPITRCKDVKRFDQLSKIDQPDVRVIVNPGGTNQRFVDSRIKQAKVRIHPDNRTIFAEIEQNRADVMITDAIEVQLQTFLNPGLCAAMPGQTLTHQEKGFLLPQDLIWKLYIDSWLNQRTQEGEVSQLFKQFLAP